MGSCKIINTIIEIKKKDTVTDFQKFVGGAGIKEMGINYADT